MTDVQTQKALTASLIGTTLGGRFEIRRRIGEGGMGVVYEAVQRPLGRTIAVKVLFESRGDAKDPKFRERFFQEAETAARLDHQHTINIIDFGDASVHGEPLFFIAMELLRGRTLSKVIRDEGPLPTERMLGIARQITLALRAAHRAGVVHRDLKPANIMLLDARDDDFVKVLDFGLAKSMRGPGARRELTRAGAFVGSPKYVSPEQIAGEPVDGRTDLYALGCVMFAMLTADVPFPGDQPADIVLDHLNLPVPSMRKRRPDLHIPRQVDRLVMRCLQKTADKRPADADAVLEKLAEIAAALSADGASLSAMKRQPRPPRPEPGHDTALLDDTEPSAALRSAITDRGPSVATTFVLTVTLGVVLGLAAVAGQKTGWIARWQNALSDVPDMPISAPRATAPRATPERGRAPVRVSVRLRTTPIGAAVEEWLEGEKLDRGRAPLLFDWVLEGNDAPRVFSVHAAGHAPTTVTLEPPTDTEGVLDVRVVLTPLSTP